MLALVCIMDFLKIYYVLNVIVTKKNVYVKQYKNKGDIKTYLNKCPTERIKEPLRYMRVIAGKARRLNLKTVEGMNTRPTQDRTKETLFNVINNDIPQSSFLDLYSGSGAIGIEALSRGAKECVFVENNRQALQCIEENLEFTKLKENALIIKDSVQNAIEMLNNQKKYFDFVFMDPPYNHLYEKDVLIFLSKSVLIDSCSMIIIEASNETEFDYLEELGFEIVKEKIYKTNKHIFVKIGGELSD